MKMRLMSYSIELISLIRAGMWVAFCIWAISIFGPLRTIGLMLVMGGGVGCFYCFIFWFTYYGPPRMRPRADTILSILAFIIGTILFLS